MKNFNDFARLQATRSYEAVKSNMSESAGNIANYAKREGWDSQKLKSVRRLARYIYDKMLQVVAFKDELLELKKLLGWNWREFERQTGIVESSFRHWSKESREARPPQKVTRAFAHYFGLQAIRYKRVHR